MFVRLFLWIPGWITSGFSKRKSAKMNENVKSPKNLPQAADSAQIVLFQQKSCLHICRQHRLSKNLWVALEGSQALQL